MKGREQRNIEENEMLDKMFTYLANQGTEKNSVDEMCKETETVRAELVKAFSEDSDIICEVIKYGFRRIYDEIFGYIISNAEYLPNLFISLKERVNTYKRELRLVYQTAASVCYGDKIRREEKYFNSLYDEYAKKLSESLGCGIDKVKPIVYLLSSAILDYIIWEDTEIFGAKIDFIGSVVLKSL